MKLFIAIQSVSDLITNSSSEIFIVKSDSPEEVKELIMNIAEQHEWLEDWEDYDKPSEEEKSKYDSSSGMGGEIDIETWKETYERHKSYIPENKRRLYTPEVWSIEYKESLNDLKKRLVIDIDWSRKATINWILENLFVYGTTDYGHYKIDPTTGRYLKRVSEEEWKQLPKSERN